MHQYKCTIIILLLYTIFYELYTTSQFQKFGQKLCRYTVYI